MTVRYFVQLFFIVMLSSAQDQMKSLCRNNSHITGKWILNESISNKNYYCCGYDYQDHRHNIALCGGITLGGLNDFQASNEWRAQSGGNACECDKREGRLSVNHREKY